MEKLEALRTLGGNAQQCSHCGEDVAVPPKMKNRFTLAPCEAALILPTHRILLCSRRVGFSTPGSLPVLCRRRLNRILTLTKVSEDRSGSGFTPTRLPPTTSDARHKSRLSPVLLAVNWGFPWFSPWV